MCSASWPCRRKAESNRVTSCRSCAHDDLNPAEVLGFAGGRIYQGQKRNTLGAYLWGRKRNFVGQHFWARGYFVSTVGRDEAAIREYIKNQEQEDKRLDQLNLWR
jgi:REP element-mobilizing transposase RayT